MNKNTYQKDNTSNNKRIAKNTLMLYFRMMLSMLVTLYTSRVVLNTLGVEDYGIYGVVGGVVVLFSFLNNAMSVATQRFLNFELGRKDLLRVKNVFNTSILIYSLLALFIIILSETVGLWFFYTKLNIPSSRLEAAFWVYQFSIFASCLAVIRIPYNALVIAYERMSFFAYISIFEVLFKLLIVFLLTSIAFDHLIVYSVLLFIVSIFVVVIYVLYCRMHFTVAKFSYSWDKTLFKQLVSYSGWNLFGASAGVAKDQGVNFLLNIFFNPLVNAAHAISMQVNGAVVQFYNSILVAAQPQIVKYYAANELASMYKLVFFVVKTIFLLLILISLPLFFETSYILQLWLGFVPSHAESFIKILLFITCIDAMATPFMTVAHATGNIKMYQGVVGTLTVCIIPISYGLLQWGILDSTVVYMVSLCMSILNFFIRLWFVKQLANFPVMNFLFQVLSRIIGMTCLLYGLMYVTSHILVTTSFFIFVLKIILSSIMALGLFFIICLNGTERRLIINKLNTIRNKFSNIKI